MDVMALKYSRRLGIGSHRFHYIFVVKCINQCTSLCLQWEFQVCVIAAMPRPEIKDTLCSWCSTLH